MDENQDKTEEIRGACLEFVRDMGPVWDEVERKMLGLGLTVTPQRAFIIASIISGLSARAPKTKMEDGIKAAIDLAMLVEAATAT